MFIGGVKKARQLRRSGTSGEASDAAPTELARIFHTSESARRQVSPSPSPSFRSGEGEADEEGEEGVKYPG